MQEMIMSDGYSEARRGTFFVDRSKLNKYNPEESLEEKEEKEEIGDKNNKKYDNI